KATLLSDAGAELMTIDLGITTDAFAGGARFGIYQSNTTTGGTATHDVAIDWARLTTTPAAPTPLTLGQLVTGNRASNSQRDLYSFTLAQPTLVMMDTKENTSNLHWTLTDERGTVSSGSWFDWPAVPLKAGSYTLKIDSGFTGDYNFRLVDLGTSAALPLGQVVSGTLTPGYGVQAWHFDATAGQHFFFDSLTDLNAHWRLYNPAGQEVFLEGAGTDRELNLALTGRYTLTLNGYNSNPTPQAYAFRIGDTGDRTVNINIGQGSDSSATWVPGAPALGGSAIDFDTRRELVVPNGAATDLRNDVTLEAWIHPDRFSNTWQPIVIKGDDVGQRSYSLWVNSGGYLRLSTYDSTGEQTLDSAAGSIPLGAWTHVSGVIDKTNHQLRLYINGVLAAEKDNIRSAPAVGTPAPLRVGTTSESNSAYGFFDGAIDEVRLWNTARTTQQIADNFGKALTGTQAGLALRLGMDEGSGTTVADSGPQALIVPVGNVYAGATGVIQGSLANPGQVDRYRFTLTQPTTLVVDSLGNSYGQVTWSLSGASGVIDSANLSQTDANDGFHLVQLQPGDYTLTLDAYGATTSPYALRLLDLATATPVALGSVVSGALNPATETLAYRFQGTAGLKLYFDELATGGGGGYYRLIGPDGQQVWTTGLDSDVDTFSLSLTGTYTLLVEGRRNAQQTNAFSFRLLQEPDQVTQVTLGTSVGNQPQVAPGRFGNALLGNGVNTVEVPDGPATDLQGNITVEAWINPTRSSTTWMPIVAKDDANNQRAYTLWLNADGSLYGDTRDATGLQGAQTVAGLIPDGSWSHVALVIDRS
ncbi:MAG TPA: LamG domain-containing protein, partial [Roseateles sp.]|nr:LamG domain-containing protein [Roseateles sp.]